METIIDQPCNVSCSANKNGNCQHDYLSYSTCRWYIKNIKGTPLDLRRDVVKDFENGNFKVEYL